MTSFPKMMIALATAALAILFVYGWSWATLFCSFMLFGVLLSVVGCVQLLFPQYCIGWLRPKAFPIAIKAVRLFEEEFKREFHRSWGRDKQTLVLTEHFYRTDGEIAFEVYQGSKKRNISVIWSPQTQFMITLEGDIMPTFISNPTDVVKALRSGVVVKARQRSFATEA